MSKAPRGKRLITQGRRGESISSTACRTYAFKFPPYRFNLHAAQGAELCRAASGFWKYVRDQLTRIARKQGRASTDLLAGASWQLFGRVAREIDKSTGKPNWEPGEGEVWSAYHPFDLAREDCLDKVQAYGDKDQYNRAIATDQLVESKPIVMKLTRLIIHVESGPGEYYPLARGVKQLARRVTPKKKKRPKTRPLTDMSETELTDMLAIIKRELKRRGKKR